MHYDTLYVFPTQVLCGATYAYWVGEVGGHYALLMQYYTYGSTEKQVGYDENPRRDDARFGRIT